MLEQKESKSVGKLINIIMGMFSGMAITFTSEQMLRMNFMGSFWDALPPIIILQLVLGTLLILVTMKARTAFRWYTMAFAVTVMFGAVFLMLYTQGKLDELLNQIMLWQAALGG